MCSCNLEAHMIGEVIMKWHQLKIKGNNHYYHMVHGKQFVSNISYLPVYIYVGRHTATPTYIKDKLSTSQNYCVVSLYIVKGMCHHIYVQ